MLNLDFTKIGVCVAVVNVWFKFILGAIRNCNRTDPDVLHKIDWAPFKDYFANKKNPQSPMNYYLIQFQSRARFASHLDRMYRYVNEDRRGINNDMSGIAALEQQLNDLYFQITPTQIPAAPSYVTVGVPRVSKRYWDDKKSGFKDKYTTIQKFLNHRTSTEARPRKRQALRDKSTEVKQLAKDYYKM